MTSPEPKLPRPDPDAAVVERARRGEYDAFEALVNRYERPIYTLALRIVREPADAQDVVQETFLSVLNHLQDFSGQAAFSTWLVRIATNHALGVLRKRKRRPAATGQGGEPGEGMPHPDFIAPWRENPEAIAQQREVQALLAEALDQLEEKYRLVFLLRDVQELSTQETAEMLGISEANVKVRLLRARLMLREILTRRFGDEGQRMAPHRHE